MFCASDGSDELELAAAKQVLEQEPLLLSSNMRDAKWYIMPIKIKNQRTSKKEVFEKWEKIGQKAN